MQLVETFRGFDVCRTAAGDLVVLDPGEPWQVRAALVEMLASADALDALFFPDLTAARRAIAAIVALDARRRRAGGE